ncbi:MAG: polyprenyl synthetase family protein [Planctomycetales bacterium]|nr:polyprenyl synthetase family protein [Planctomycetales bacterium]
MTTDTFQKHAYNKERFTAALADKATLTGRVLAELLEEQTEIPPRLREAMDYMLQSGGKRIRAALVMWACEIVSGLLNPDAQIAAAAVEMVHTYSLIHDDLPAMDDDDMRRGRPSCHKRFDEATAILAGDALLTLAFEVLASEIDNPAIAVRMIRTLSEAAGPSGMIAGQAADMEGPHVNGSLAKLEYIHLNKTAEMFAASAALGAIAGRANDGQMSALLEYGMKIGLGFQIADDLLDMTASSSQLGKTAGKDAAQGKLTYPALIGMEKSRAIFETFTCQAIAAIQDFGPEADLLRQMAMELYRRTQ